MTTKTADTVDVLIALLAGEQAGLFHFMSEADPHIDRASASLRRPLQQMIAQSRRHEAELTGVIAEMGGTSPPVPVNMEYQYLAFLTLDYLLPKLREAKLASIHRYTDAVKRLDGGDGMVEAMLLAHLNDHRRDLALLNDAATPAA